ncbi:MAG TPA: type 4a pilus biogenesis protein PilO [Lacunisphaera sp.]|nr:type 4a pilus biogenesis protein PilO [Lacunisphaera sp.]
MSDLLRQFLAAARRYPVAVVSLILFVLLGVGDYLLWKRRGELGDAYEQTRQKGEAMLLSLNSHARIVAQAATLDEALAYINKNLITESDLAGNMDYFYQIEKATKTRLTNLAQLSSQPSTEEEAYRAIPFNLRLSGTYPQVLAFLHQLETGPRLLRVKNYRFAQSDAAAIDGLSLDLTVEMLGHP